MRYFVPVLFFHYIPPSGDLKWNSPKVSRLVLRWPVHIAKNWAASCKKFPSRRHTKRRMRHLSTVQWSNKDSWQKSTFLLILSSPSCGSYCNQCNQVSFTNTITNMAAFNNFHVTFSKVLIFFMIVALCKFFLNNVNSQMKATVQLFSLVIQNIQLKTSQTNSLGPVFLTQVNALFSSLQLSKWGVGVAKFK